MTPSAFVQRNPYKGVNPRSWVRLRFEAADGTLHERELIADTGCPFVVILGLADLALLERMPAPGTPSTFGPLTGAQFALSMPELGLTAAVLGYGNDTILQDVRQESPDFAGLPLLRMLEYGGDSTAFWVRKASGTP
jgi:hypothetical protein